VLGDSELLRPGATGSALPLLIADGAGQAVADVLTLAGPWWPGDSAGRELPDEPLMTSLEMDLAGKPWTDWLGSEDLDILAASR